MDPDRQLVRLAINGNKAAFGKLAKKYRDAVLSLAYDFLGDYENAKDVAQDVFMTAFKNIGDFEENSHFSSWLFRITVLTSLNLQKAKVPRGKYFKSKDIKSDTGQVIAESVGQNGIDDTLYTALKKLTDHQQSAIILRYFHDKSTRDIADTLECTESTVRGHLHRALQKLEKSFYKRKRQVMKSGCEFEQLFEGYFRSDLSPAEELVLLKHLESCSSCPENIDKFYRVHTALSKFNRPPVSTYLQSSYYQQVDLSFGRETLSQKISLIFSRFTGKRSPLFRFLQFTTLILIGIIVGWVFFAPVEPKIVYQSNDPYQMSQPISLKDIDYVHAYLQLSQMILLAIQNDTDFYLDRELAQKLLIKTYRVKAISSQLNNLRMINFLNRMELLLHDASNLNVDEVNESISRIKIWIEEADLLREVQDLKLMMEMTKAQFGT
jgi:RNA polymerase sigma-70 factor (ECF subfamily)